MSAPSPLTYGTCVALGNTAALLLGASGSGKSDLALRFIMLAASGTLRDLGTAALVSDDQVLLQTANGRIIARAPGSIAGKIEVRGLGIVGVPFREEAELRLAVRLSSPREIPRLPPDPPATLEFCGLRVPVMALAPFEASAPLKLRLALQSIAR